MVVVRSRICPARGCTLCLMTELRPMYLRLALLDWRSTKESLRLPRCVGQPVHQHDRGLGSLARTCDGRQNEVVQGSIKYDRGVVGVLVRMPPHAGQPSIHAVARGLRPPQDVSKNNSRPPGGRTWPYSIVPPNNDIRFDASRIATTMPSSTFNVRNDHITSSTTAQDCWIRLGLRLAHGTEFLQTT